MSEIINCPSGLSGPIRGMKVREERVLADRKLANNGGQVDERLGACWEETLDAGPYDFGDKVVDWGQVLQGDRLYALLQIRALTYGPEYAFAVYCGSDGCRARIEWTLDLRELPCRPLSEESLAAFTDGNRFETVFMPGKRMSSPSDGPTPGSSWNDEGPRAAGSCRSVVDPGRSPTPVTRDVTQSRHR